MADPFQEEQNKLLYTKPAVFVEQDREAQLKVYERRKQELLDAFGPANINSIYHVGSTAIKGMPGSPIIDIIVFINSWPPTEAMYKTLDDLKYFPMGDDLKAPGDKWFLFNDEGNPIQEVGSGVLHLVSKDNEEMYNKLVLWVEYCNNNEEAFEAYKAIKLKAKEASSYIKYKDEKTRLTGEILHKAVEWKKHQKAKENKQSDLSVEEQRASLRTNPAVFVEQDREAQLKVYERRRIQLLEALGQAEIDSIHHIGSTAIKGMPGSPIIDIIVLLNSWPPTEAMYKTLDDLKYFPMGDAPHGADDKWFLFNDEGNPIQEVGSGVVHLASKDNEVLYNRLVLWVDYCNNNEEAFEAYKAIKLKAKEASNYIDYKAEKVRMTGEILHKAVEWKKQQKRRENAQSDTFQEEQGQLLYTKPAVFVEQDREAQLKVYEKRRQELLEAFGPSEIDSIHHVGSTAIRGMPGSPIIDIIVFINSWPPTEAMYKTLDDLKYFPMGDDLKAPGDKWFLFNEEGNPIQEVGSGVLHLVSKHNEEMYNKLVLWVEYCNNNEEAFEAYKAIKLKAKEASSYIKYKDEKTRMTGEILHKAVEWKKQQKANENTE